MKKLFCGLDVADKTTALCVIEECGEILLEQTTETTPQAVAAALRPYRRRLKSIGLEIGSKSTWLYKALLAERLPVRALDARHAHSALKARLNKTDANDALGLATLMARGIFTEAYVKNDDALRIRVFLSLRETLLRKKVDLNHAVSMVGKLLTGEAARPTRRRNQTSADSAASLALASVRRISKAAESEIKQLDAVLEELVEESPVCKRLTTIPGVGVLTALTFFAAIDDPHRFEASREVGAYFGLSPRVFQSGGVSRSGGISHRGDRSVRRALFIAARVLLVNSRSQCSLRRWGLKLAKAKGRKVACVAVARKLAALMHHLWVTGAEFDPSR